jgi:hypothetical protein
MPSPSKTKKHWKQGFKVKHHSLGAPVQLRLSEDLKTRILMYQVQVFNKLGVEMSFSVALRSLIEKGLEASQ